MIRLLSNVMLVMLFAILLLFPNIARAGLPGDLNGDGIVSISEVQTTINAFLGLASNTTVDLNGDEVVSISEVQTVINAFLGSNGSISISISY